MTNVIVQGVFVVDPGERDQFIEASIEGMRASRAEAGCLEYVFAADPLDSGRVVLSERWESMELLQQHLNGQSSRSAGDRPKPTSAEIVMYEVASATKLI
ncbi:MAG TPA: putative quinol monooxygenase [Acidimicrobiales bacterium]|nr:putative quinol monooxygenase [Acidimicrobiales bacterium]